MPKLSTASQTLMAIATGFVLSLGTSEAALAQSGTNTAARVNATIKPCFGMLLDAQMKTCGGVSYKKRGHNHGYNGSGRADGRINCDTARPGALEAMVRSIRPGGVLRISAKSRSCHGTLDVSKSITIIGDGFAPNSMPAITAPDGQPCVRISPSARKVTLKNIYLNAPRAQMASCVESYNTELTLQNALVRYEGDNAALMASGGRVNIIEASHISAKSKSAAVALNGVVLLAENSHIASTSSGIYALLSGDSVIQGVSLQQLADWHGFERGEGATGLDLQLDSRGAIMTINAVQVNHFATGMTLNGAGEILVSNSLIANTNHAMVSGLERLRMVENTLLAREIGINIENGTAFLGRNAIAKVRTGAILADSGAQIRAVDNRIDPGSDGCANLSWGNIPPAERTCTPWFEGSQFDAPSDADQQQFYADFWPSNAMPYQAVK
jgi:hypothetical protein